MRAALIAGLVAAGLLTAREARAQTDPRLVAAVRQAQEGQVDSARAVLRRLAAATPATDVLYPEILYAIALTAADVTERERSLQRVTVEFPLSAWMDDALLLLAESDYAGGNLPGAARDLERIRRDFPASPLMADAAVWAARSYFDMRNQRSACSWIVAGLRQGGADAAVHAQLGAQARRCGALIAASDTIAPPPAAPLSAAVTPAPPAVVPAGADSSAGIRVAAARADSARADSARADSARADSARSDTMRNAGAPASGAASRTDSSPPVATPPGAARGDAARPAPASGDTTRVNGPAHPAGRFRVQLAAAATQRDADAIVRGLSGRGIAADVTAEKGFFKVRTGRFASRREAQAEATRLRGTLGTGAFVVSE
jgi:SPOR domain